MRQEHPLWSPATRRYGLPESARLRLLALRATTELGEAIASALGPPLAAHEERQFEDGEHKTRPLETVGGMDVYVVQSLHGGPSESANDKLCRLLFFIGALKNAGAARVTAVVPYTCYARKDRRTKPNDPEITRYVASLLTAVGSRHKSRPDRRAAQIFPSRVFGGGFWRKSLRRTHLTKLASPRRPKPVAESYPRFKVH